MRSGCRSDAVIARRRSLAVGPRGKKSLADRTSKKSMHKAALVGVFLWPTPPIPHKLLLLSETSHNIRPSAAQMPKRKLSELNDPPRFDARKLSMKAIRLAHKFEQGVQLISKSLKTARGFERQKLSRREKTAKAEGNATTLSRLGDEVEALKVCAQHESHILINDG